MLSSILELNITSHVMFCSEEISNLIFPYRRDAAMDHTSKTSRIRQYFIDRPGQVFGPADIAMALKLESAITVRGGKTTGFFTKTVVITSLESWKRKMNLWEGSAAMGIQKGCYGSMFVYGGLRR